MAKKTNPTPTVSEPVSEETISNLPPPPDTNQLAANPAALLAAPADVAAPESDKVLLAVGGYQHLATKATDGLSIATAGLPGDFALVVGDQGYFPGDFPKRFVVTAIEPAADVLLLKIDLL